MQSSTISLSSHRMCSVIQDMIENDDDEDDSDSKGWINIIDSGGLLKVNDIIYGFFLSIEMVVR